MLKYTRVPRPPSIDPAPPPNARLFDGQDQLLVRFPDRHETIDFWSLGSTVRLIPLTKVQGDSGLFAAHKASKYICGWIAGTALEHHLAFDCVKRPVWLKGEHDATSFHGQVAEFRHSVEEAGRRNDMDEFIVAPPTTGE